MSDTNLATLFGLSRGLDRDELVQIEDYLRAAWRAQHGRSPATLTGDLDRLKELFKTNAVARRVRDVRRSLKPIPGQRPELPDAVFVAVDERRGIVTPEGRILLDELVLLRESGEFVLSRDAVARATARAAAVYGVWQREWLHKHLLGGDIRPGTYGFVLFLLINGCTDRRTGLPMPGEDHQELQLAEVVAPVIEAFEVAIGGKVMAERERRRLRSNWRVTEASAQLPEQVHRDKRGDNAIFWIDDEHQLVRTLAERLAARELTIDRLQVALGKLVDAYEDVRSRLTAFGLAHGRSARTQRLVAELIDEFTRARART